MAKLHLIASNKQVNLHSRGKEREWRQIFYQGEMFCGTMVAKIKHFDRFYGRVDVYKFILWGEKSIFIGKDIIE